VRRFIPMVNMLTDQMIAEITPFSIRELAKMHGRLLLLSSKKLDKIDQALSEIHLKPKESISTSALEGSQITQVLAAGYFSGSDCEAILNDDFLNGENNAAPVLGEEITRDDFSTTWQVQHSSPDGFRFKEMAFNGPLDYSASYMSFYLNSPRRLDNLLIEPNLPQLYLNLETACCLQVWLNGQEISTQEAISATPIKLQIPLLLIKGSNHILIKVVNINQDYIVKAYLSSSQDDFIEKLESNIIQ